MSYLVLVRHGESIWNKQNKFTGWMDVPLSRKGIKEALVDAKKLKKIDFERAFTSKLERAQETLLIILAEQKKVGVFLHSKKKERDWSKQSRALKKKEIPVFTAEELNERYYGRLQGVDKDAARRKYGKEKVFVWRRSYKVKPPGGESLQDVYKRAVPYFQKEILPCVKKGEDVIVSAHGNSLRAILKKIEGIEDEHIPYLEIPLGEPIIYQWKNGRLARKSRNHSFNRPIIWR